LQRHVDRHDWIDADDLELIELARLVGLKATLQPLLGSDV
jgi:hypothetical protein